MSDLDPTAPEGVEPEETEAKVETPTEEPKEAEAVEADPDVEAPEDVEDEADAEDDEDVDPEGEDEEIEFDFGGNKMRVRKGEIPDELAERVSQFTKDTWADYTRKSQDAAEKAKSLEARETALDGLSRLNDDVLNEYSNGLRLRNELAQLEQVDVNALWQSDPDRARRVSDTIQAKRAELQSVAQAVGQKEQELTQAQETEISRRREEGKATIEKRVKGFTQNVPAVVQYVSDTYGIDKTTLERDWPLNPATAEMAYKAMKFDEMQARAKRPKPKPATPIKAPKGKGGPATKDPDKMSPEEWLKWRNKQLSR